MSLEKIIKQNKNLDNWQHLQRKKEKQQSPIVSCIFTQVKEEAAEIDRGKKLQVDWLACYMAFLQLEKGQKIGRERERERERERDRDRDRQTDRQRQRETERDRH